MVIKIQRFGALGPGLRVYRWFKVILVGVRAAFLWLAAWLIYRDSSVFLEWAFYYRVTREMVIGVYLDWMRAIFLSVVCFISCNILGYCVYYIRGEKNSLRFILILLLFVGSIVLLIISPNLVSILLG